MVAVVDTCEELDHRVRMLSPHTGQCVDCGKLVIIDDEERERVQRRRDKHEEGEG